MKKILILSVLLIFFFHTPVPANENLPLHLKIMSTKKVVEPHVWNNTIFLSAKPEGNPRFVGVAFDYESYSAIHPFEINESGVYIYSAQAPEEMEIRYRIIVDGLWMADPLGQDNFKDEYGIMVSKLEIASSPFVSVKGPVVQDTGQTTFSVRSRPDSAVSIVGSFNGWDPYMTPMRESSTGVYTTDLKLKDGSYFYYFIIDGKKAMDPMNFLRAYNREGEEVCKIDISRT